MCPKEFEWKDTEYRGAVVPLVREVGRGSVLHASSYFDDKKRILWVGIWWIAETPDSEKSRILERCTEALREWKGLRGYEPRVITARKPYRPTPILGSPAYDKVRKRRW